MKSQMLKLMSVMMVCLLFSVAIFAKHGGNPEERSKRMTERMTKHLGLSPQQSQAVEQINLQVANELFQIKQSAQSKEQKKAAAKNVLQNHERNLQSVLNQEQFAKFQEIKKKKMQKGGKHRGGKKQPKQGVVEDMEDFELGGL